MIQSITIPITILGAEFVAEVEFEITSHGHGGTPPSMNYPGDPPEPAEFDIKSVYLRRDDVENAPNLTLPSWLDDLITESDAVNEKIQEVDWESTGGYEE